jgi:hypothetical protein
MEIRAININKIARFFLVNFIIGLSYSAFIGSDYINPSKIHHPAPKEFLSLGISLILMEIVHIAIITGYMGYYCFKERSTLITDILCFLVSVVSIALTHLLFAYWLNSYPKFFTA